MHAGPEVRCFWEATKTEGNVYHSVYNLLYYLSTYTPRFETLPRKISCGQSYPCCLDDGCGRGSGRGHCPQAEGG